MKQQVTAVKFKIRLTDVNRMIKPGCWLTFRFQKAGRTHFDFHGGGTKQSVPAACFGLLEG
jgi:hypothetical protein